MKHLVVMAAGLGYEGLERRKLLRMGGLEFRPAASVFPAVTCVAQASFRTAADPCEHGMTSNGFYSRALRKPAFWEQSAALVEGPRIWDRVRAAGETVGLYFWQQSLGERVDSLISPAPIHKHGGGMIMRNYTQPPVMGDALDKAGFANVPTCLDEWLPAPSHDKLGTALQAAEVAAALIAFQNGPVDSAAIYDARCGLGEYSPLFNPLTYKPHKAYYAFLAFHELRKRGTVVLVDVNHEIHEPHEAIYAAAALSEKAPLAVMLANTGDEEAPFVLEVAGDSSIRHSSFVIRSSPEAAPPASVRCRIVDETRTWEEAPLPAALPPHSLLLVEFA